MLVPASATAKTKATALDITLTDPLNKIAIGRGSHSKPLEAPQQLFGTQSSWRHTRKHSRRQGTKFSPSRRPLVFETIGAMREETQKWRKSIVIMEADQGIPDGSKV